MSRLLSFIAVLICIGCTSSGVYLKPISLKVKVDKVTLLPFKEPKESFTSSDASSDFRPPLVALIATAIDDTTGIYTYGFDAADFSNLRLSILESLRSSKSIGEVVDQVNSEDMSDGIFLDVVFTKTGVNATGYASTCYLEGTLYLLSSDGKILKKQDYSIKEESSWTVGKSKSDAITAFLDELNSFLKHYSA